MGDFAMLLVRSCVALRAASRRQRALCHARSAQPRHSPLAPIEYALRLRHWVGLAIAAPLTEMLSRRPAASTCSTHRVITRSSVLSNPTIWMPSIALINENKNSQQINLGKRF